MSEKQQHYNPHLKPFMEIVDLDNGTGYSENLPKTGMLIKFPEGNTKMMYEVKHIDNIIVVFIRYIHYDNKKELLSLLAFAVQWWRNLNPQVVYMREKARKNSAGEYLTALGFTKGEVKNTLKPFDCNIDGTSCKCPVYEYYAYNIAK